MQVTNINDTTQEEIEKYSSPLDEKEDKQNQISEQNRLLLSFKHILDFYYGNISTKTILNFAPNSQDGFTNEMVVDISFDMGLNAVVKNIKAQEIATYFMPCIIFNEKNEAFILVAKANREVVLINPVTNQSSNHDSSYLKHFSKAILIFRDSKKSEFIDIKKTKSWFWTPVKSFWRTYIEIGFLTFFINIFALAIPLFTMSVYDRVVPNNATETLFVLAVGVIIILLFDLLFKSARNHIIEKTGKKLGMFFEDELMRRMLNVRSGYDTMLTGMKASLFRELAQVKEFFAARSIVQVIDFPFFFIALITIYVISPAIAVVPFSIALIIIIVNLILQIPVSALAKDRLKNMQTKQSYVIELIQGSEMIKLSNATPTKLFNWRNIVAFSDLVSMKIQSINVFSTNLSQTLMQFLTLGVIIVGVYEISINQLTVGGLIAVTILSTRAMVPVVQISGMIVRFKEIQESLNIINDFWYLPLESHNQVEIGLGKLSGDIEFKDVSFFYEKSKYPSAKDLSFKIKAGEKVGIIGQTGAGKSTILRMLTALDSPSSGSIFLDDHDISTIHPVELRQNIGVMPQEPFLFDGTLKENIELSAPISKERMMELIKMIGLEELVKKSGAGDGMRVGEGGKNLSVGQRHLVSLARAVVNDPSILILDEPTTGLDIGLERTVVAKMDELLKDKTLIVITHRFTALDLVNRVIVLNEGQIVADGPKDAILNALRGKKIMQRLFEEENWNYKLIVVPIMALFTVFIVWASFSEIDEVVRGGGKVVPSGQTKIIQHLEGGIISKILVKEGDEVKKGDKLYELSQAFFTADFNTKDIKLKSLQAKAIRILAQVDLDENIIFPKNLSKRIPNIIENEKDIFVQDTQSNLQKIQIQEDKLKQKILKHSELESKRDNLDLELKLARENMKILDNMYKKKVVSKQKYLKELQLKQSLITKISNVRGQLPIVQQEINEALSQVKSVKSEIKSKLLKEYSKVQVEISTLKENAKANKDRDTRKAILSPVNGTIQKLHFYTVGGIIKPGDKVAEITPTNDSLIIEAKIKTSDRALVYSGQKVKIAITAYDTSKYGLLNGEVLFVSSDSEENLKTSVSFYTVRVKANLSGFAPDLPILPGMIANINILTGKKTIMQYIIKPLKDISRNSLTEK